MEIAGQARNGHDRSPLAAFAAKLYRDPADVTGNDVALVAESVGFPKVVETIGVISRLAAIDRFHIVIGIQPPELPQPVEGDPTGEIIPDLQKRRGHVPMPPGPIPVSLDLVPAEGRAMMDLHGSLYMSEEQMEDAAFARVPGLNTPQLEVVATRVSLLNECFY